MSRVVNGTGYVAPATVARVDAIVKELGYRPNGFALSFQGQRPPLVGLVTAPNGTAAGEGDGPGSVAERLRAGLAAVGVPLVLCPVTGSVADSPFLDLLLDGRLGALVVPSDLLAEPALAEVARSGHAVVALDLADAPAGVTTATPGEEAGAVLSALVRSPAVAAPTTE